MNMNTCPHNLEKDQNGYFCTECGEDIEYEPDQDLEYETYYEINNSN